MKLLVGLGNSEKKYRNTRHNAGFILLEKIRTIWEFPEFEMNSKFNAEISKGILETRNSKLEILLVKPQTFMNLSGVAVKSILDFYKLSTDDIIIIHDDLDINLGEYKISTDASAAGHNGVQSIFDNLDTQKIKRVRIGIEGAEKRKSRAIFGDVFVLQSFSEEELITIKNLSEEIVKYLSV